MAKSKEALRLAVGTSTNCQSSVWRLWVNGDDVYFGARDLIQAIKVSLHASGKWRLAWVDSLEQSDSAKDRVVFKWERPTEFSPGCTGSVVVVVPILRPRKPFKRLEVGDSAIQWIRRPHEARQVTLKLILCARQRSREQLESVLEPDHQIYGGMRKTNGETVWVIVRDSPMSSEAIRLVKDVRQKLRINLHKGSAEDSVFNARAYYFECPPVPDELTQPWVFDIGVGRDSIRIEK